MSTYQLAQYRVGAELARYVRSRTGQEALPVTALQAVVADITALTPDLAIPLSDLVSRQSFQVLIPLAGSGSGELQRKALVDDIRKLYNQDVVQSLVEVLNGFLGLKRETATRFEKSLDNSTVITPKEEAETSTSEYSIKDIGSYEPRYFQEPMVSSEEIRNKDLLENSPEARRREIPQTRLFPELAYQRRRTETSPRVNQSKEPKTGNISRSGRMIGIIMIGIIMIGMSAIIFEMAGTLAGLERRQRRSNCADAASKLSFLPADSAEFQRLMKENKSSCMNSSAFMKQYYRVCVESASGYCLYE